MSVEYGPTRLTELLGELDDCRQSYDTLATKFSAEQALVEEASRTIVALVSERDALAKQVSELRAALKLCVARLDEYEDARDGIALECGNVALAHSA